MARLEELNVQAVREDDANMTIVVGTPLAGLARTLKDYIPMPVVNDVSSTIRRYESPIALAPNGATEGNFAHSSHRPDRGLPPVLAAILA